MVGRIDCLPDGFLSGGGGDDDDDDDADDAYCVCCL